MTISKPNLYLILRELLFYKTIKYTKWIPFSSPPPFSQLLEIIKTSILFIYSLLLAKLQSTCWSRISSLV